ncbi:MAG: M23 family metallopeptidase [Bacteroidales bacterium]|jgi:murein DD-endopeptidase MepM/ murein hydrolase activator NlpD|nr:M23 family metallopeptidase [Bacteroidales bacterium]
MGKVKYKFNKDTLNYDEVVVSKWKRVFRLLTYVSASIFIAFIYYIIYSSFFDTPKERELKRECEMLTSYYQTLNKKFDRVDNVLKDIQQRDDNIYRSIYATEPIPWEKRVAGIGGASRNSELDALPNSDLVKNTSDRLDDIARRLYVQSRSFDEIISLVKNKEDMLRSIPAIQPISNRDLKRVASPFGMRIHPFYKVPKEHHGMDFTASSGTEIFATGDGVIKTVDHSKRGYGNKVVINHGYNYSTLYAHMSKIIVRKGQKVKRGQVIGYVGSTGMSMAPHLHYEVRISNKPVDPINYYFNDLTPEQFDKMIQLAANSGQAFD